MKDVTQCTHNRHRKEKAITKDMLTYLIGELQQMMSGNIEEKKEIKNITYNCIVLFRKWQGWFLFTLKVLEEKYEGVVGNRERRLSLLGATSASIRNNHNSRDAQL